MNVVLRLCLVFLLVTLFKTEESHGQLFPGKLFSGLHKRRARTDEMGSERGYSGKMCDRENMQSSAGVVTSPSFPYTYHNDMDCSWLISTSHNKVITVNFLDFELESDEDCDYDFVSIYDGRSSVYSKLLGKFCGTKIPETLTSSGPKMLVVFHTDNSISYFRGFNMTYSTSYKIVAREVCNRPAYTGNCRASFRRWFYNTAIKDCDTFTYGGCNSNGNNFRTKAECVRECKGQTKTVDSNECSKANGGCNQLCHNTAGSYYCSCWQGYAIDSDQRTCKDVDECSLGRDTHHCEHTCYNMPGSYYCGCNHGFVLSANRKTCDDVNECPGPCEQNCTNTPGSFRCSCFRGFRERFGDPMRCRDINECEHNPPDCHKCTNLEGSYRCECKLGFKLNKGGTACLDIDECLVNNGGCSQLCINQPGSHMCQCRDGFHSTDPKNRTCEDIDECLSNNGKGDCEYQCTNFNGSFRCSCPEGYQVGEDQLSCSDTDECELDNGGCNQKCINLPSSHKCDCYDGYEAIGKNGSNDVLCQDIDECYNGTHKCDTELGAICVNEIGNYSCICPPGYYSERKNCIDVNECDDPTINDCNQHCQNTPGSFYCECFEGYSVNPETKTCTDIDECSSSPCSEICINSAGSFSCECHLGYYLGEDKSTCLDINECENNNGLCQHICINSNGSYTCQCRDGFSLAAGLACVDNDECTSGSACCDTECENEDGGYRCKCLEGYFLSRDNCTCQDTNECSVNNGGCDHVCNNTNGGFSCSCQPGYEPDQTNSSHCLDINECLKDNGGCSQLCKNTPGGYECLCKPVYKLASDGKTCDHCPTCENFEELIQLVEQLKMEVQSLKNWKASFGTTNTDCRFKAKTYKDSDSWEDGNCRRCICENGQVLCFQDQKCFGTSIQDSPKESGKGERNGEE